MNYGEIIKFTKTKDLKYIKTLGKGGGGETHLFIDEVVDMQFAIKKYNPIEVNRVPGHFQRFVDEVKILYKLSHPNIVRIYNSFIYPVSETGYIQMEYIEGVPIDQYDENSRSKNWEQIFLELIEAFQYLEKNRILHRDIKPQNILIDNNDVVKIIDFGFSKHLEQDESNGKSVLLEAKEYPYELKNNLGYSEKTEIFYLGLLIKDIIDKSKINFEYYDILNKMISNDEKERFQSFEQIHSMLIRKKVGFKNFSDDDKKIYGIFADSLIKKIAQFNNLFTPVNDIKIILFKFEQLLSDCALESYLQNNNRLIEIFVKNDFYAFSTKDIKIEVLRNFYTMLSNQSISNQEIIVSNLINRLSSVKVEIVLPF